MMTTSLTAMDVTDVDTRTYDAGELHPGSVATATVATDGTASVALHFPADARGVLVIDKLLSALLRARYHLLQHADADVVADAGQFDMPAPIVRTDAEAVRA